MNLEPDELIVKWSEERGSCALGNRKLSITLIVTGCDKLV